MQNQSTAIPKWSALLIGAVTKPGLIMKAYTAFHAYSTGNQLLAVLECQMRGLLPGPINTFPKWKDLGRFVKRGERALTLCMPITRKRRVDEAHDDEAEREETYTSFIYKARWFVLALLERAGIQNFRFPDLRHTFASWYMMNGGALYKLAKILGHPNIKMTERYAKLARQPIARTSGTARELWKILEP